MNSRFILMLVFCMMGVGVFAQTGKKKSIAKTAKGSVKKKVVTEAEAKKLHEEQLAKEGQQNVRRAYKRSDFELGSNTDAVAWDGDASMHPRATLPPQPKAAPVQAKPTIASPKFIETIVLERKEG